MPLHGHKSDRVQQEDRGERSPIGQSGGGQAKAYDWPSKHRHLSPYSPPPGDVNHPPPREEVRVLWNSKELVGHHKRTA